MCRAISKPEYAKVDAYAVSAPETKAKILVTLVDYLTIPYKDEELKVRSIYRWMTSHISYDWDAYTNGTYSFQEPATTLLRRKGVCQNFSDLFTAMCTQAKVEAKTISGYAKSNVDNSWVLYGFSGSNHAWNVVKVKGVWRLVDVTWDEGVGGDFYFFTDPISFRKDHLPASPVWQLTTDTMTLDQYQNTPRLGWKFDDLGIKNLTSYTCRLTGKKKYIITFECDKTIVPSVVVKNYDYTNKTTPRFLQSFKHEGNLYTVTIAFTDQGLYWMDLQLGEFYSDKIATYAVDTYSSTVGTKSIGERPEHLE